MRLKVWFYRIACLCCRGCNCLRVARELKYCDIASAIAERPSWLGIRRDDVLDHIPHGRRIDLGATV